MSSAREVEARLKYALYKEVARYVVGGIALAVLAVAFGWRFCVIAVGPFGVSCPSPSPTSPPDAAQSQAQAHAVRLCPVAIDHTLIESLSVGATSAGEIDRLVNEFDADRTQDQGSFKQGTTLPAGVVVATNFDERPSGSTAWQRFPVVPLAHSGSYGIFRTIGEYTAPNDGACRVIAP